MFNNRKIKSIEFDVKCLREGVKSYRQRYWELRRDLDDLAARVGYRFEDVAAHRKVVSNHENPAP